MYMYNKQTSASGLSTENVLWASDLHADVIIILNQFHRLIIIFIRKRLVSATLGICPLCTLPITVRANFFFYTLSCFCYILCMLAGEGFLYNMLDTAYPSSSYMWFMKIILAIREWKFFLMMWLFASVLGCNK